MDGKKAISFLLLMALSSPLVQGQDRDEEKARGLIRSLGGLPENFTREQFLDRPALSELLVLDRAAVAPLEDVLRTSQDWTMRATAAYLLTHIGDTFGFFEIWKREPSLTVKMFLYAGARGDVVDYTVLLRELERLPKSRRDELDTLAETPPVLSDAQTRTRMDRLIAVLNRSESEDLDGEGLRVLCVLSDSGVVAVGYLADAFFAFTRLDAKENVLVTLTDACGGINSEDAKAVEAVRPHLSKVLSILEVASGSSEELRYKTLNLALTLALLLEAAKEDPEPALNILRRFASTDSRDDIRQHAKYLLARWKAESKGRRDTSPSTKKKADDTVTPEDKVRPVDRGVAVRREPTNAPSEDPSTPGKKRDWLVWGIGLSIILAAMLIVLRHLRNRKSV